MSQYCWHPWVSLAVTCVSLLSLFLVWGNIACYFPKDSPANCLKDVVIILYAQLTYSKTVLLSRARCPHTQPQQLIVHQMINTAYTVCSRVINTWSAWFTMHVVDMNLLIWNDDSTWSFNTQWLLMINSSDKICSSFTACHWCKTCWWMFICA